MFTHLLTNQYYRFIKSGLLLDFLSKRIALATLRFTYVILNVFFSEKYIIEHLFLRSFSFYNDLRRFVATPSTQLAYVVISFFICSVLVLIIFI